MDELRRIRGKWACAHCETLIQVPVDAHILDKGIPTTGLLAQVGKAVFRFLSGFNHDDLYQPIAIIQLTKGVPDFVFWAEGAEAHNSAYRDSWRRDRNLHGAF